MMSYLAETSYSEPVKCQNSKKTRTPLTVLQLLPSNRSCPIMSASKTFGAPNKTTLVSKHLPQNRQKGIILSASNLRETSSVTKSKPVESATKRSLLPKANICDKISAPSKSVSSTKTRSDMSSNESKNKVVSSDSSVNKVQSLTSSPKWSRIKDKFENGTPTSKPALTKCSSLSSNNDKETSKLKTPFSRPSSKSLTTLKFDNNFASHKDEYLRGHSSSKKTDTRIESSTIIKSTRSDLKTASQYVLPKKKCVSNIDTRGSSNLGRIKGDDCDAQKINISSKKENGESQNKNCKSKNVPISAQAAASSLLPVSTRVSNAPKKNVSGSRATNSLIKQKWMKESPSNSSSLDSSLKTEQKDSSTPNRFQSHKTSSQTKLDTTKSVHCSSPNNSNKHHLNRNNETLHKSPTNTTPRNSVAKHHISSCSADVDKKPNKLDTNLKLENVNTNLNKSPVSSIELKNAALLLGKGKNIWVKDDVGNWTKNVIAQELDIDSSGDHSKVALLRSKFNSLTDGQAVQSTKTNHLCKSNTTSSVPSEHEKDISIRPLSKSSTTSNILSPSPTGKSITTGIKSNTDFDEVFQTSKVVNKEKKQCSTVGNINLSGSTHESESSSPEESSPEKIRKLSLVQRAVLSYEENLALLSPETQKKLKLLGEKVKAQTDDDKILVAKAKNDILACNFRKTIPLNNDSTNAKKGSECNQKQNCDSYQIDDPVPPVRNFLCRFQNMHKSRNDDKMPYNKSNNKDRHEKRHSSDEEKFSGLVKSNSNCPWTDKLPLTSTDLTNLKNSKSKQEREKTVSNVSKSIFDKSIFDKSNAYSSNDLCTKLNNVQSAKKDVKDIARHPMFANHIRNARFSGVAQKLLSANVNKDSDQSLQPNTSFLWRHSDSTESDTTDDPAVAVKAQANMDYSNYYALENYYSPLEFETKSNVDDGQGSLSSNSTVKLEAGETRYQNIPANDDLKQGKYDVDDGWTDFSDNELNSKTSHSKTSTMSSTLKKKKNKRYSHYKGQLQRSWSQSLRDITNGSDACQNNSSLKDDASSSDNLLQTSNVSMSPIETADIDHYYEPVYESLGNYLINGDNDENDSISMSPDDDRNKDELHSSYTSLESIQSDKLFSAEGGKAPLPEIQPVDTVPSRIGKKAGDKIRQLKRHLSWTKSDIRLELSSKFNKIKIKKNLHNSTEIGVRVEENSTTRSSPKKNTFIKCILRQKSASSIPVKRSPSPKKESALFYVHLSMSREKQRPFSDSCIENTSQGSYKNDKQLPKSRKTAESMVNSDAQYPSGKMRKGSSGQIIQRPKTPPPLPPTKFVPKNSKKIDNSNLQENTSSLYNSLSKENSLYAEFKSGMKQISSVNNENSSQLKTAPSDGTSLAEQVYTDVEFGLNSPTSLYSTIESLGTVDTLSRRTRNSIASSGSLESYAPTYESGSSATSSSTTYSSGFTLHISESNTTPLNGGHTTSNSSELSLPLFANFKTDLLKSPFEEEPMYQFYHKDVQQRATLWYSADGSESELDDYPVCKIDDNEIETSPKPPPLQSQMSAMELVHGEGGQRTLWCEVPEVQKSGVLESISVQDRKIQEAMFEVITSEASYLKSLNFLREHFVQCPEFSGEFSEKHILDKRERHILFSDVPPVRDVSASLLADLEKRWLENIVLSNVCDIIYDHASKYFSVYVKYCSNQIYQDRTLKQLKENRPHFVEVLKRLESNPVCQGLVMHSFLMLPMQRITRLPLLIDAIFHRLSVDSPIYESCKMALAMLNKLVAECNEGARKMERMEEMLVISHQLDFQECKGLGLLSASRWLVKKGELVRLLLDNTNRRTFGRNVRWCKIRLFLFLFTDLLVITRKKSDDTYSVVDYCPRNMVQVIPVDENVTNMPPRLPSSYRNVFQMIMLSNSEGRTVEMLLSCLLESDRTRWMDAVTPAKSENPDEKIYEEWDCPQVQCTHAYSAQQPDELSIEESDVVNVFRKMADGWYEGERIRDGVRGWFPSSHTVEIISSHVRARNLRQRYRLLMLSQTFLEEQQKAQTAIGKVK